jgi:hypothetical protein
MKITLKNTLFIGLILAKSFNSQAQDEKVIVMDKKDFKNLKNEKKEPIIFNGGMVFKFDPTRIILGEIAFGLEKRIGDYSSLEVELGPTISNLTGFKINHLNYYSSYTSYYNEKSGVGIFGSIGYRFYPKGVFNGLYISPKFKYKLYNSSFVDPSGILENQNGSRTQSSFIFNVGFQKWTTKNFSFDFYTGLGVGYVTNTKMVSNGYYDPSYGNNYPGWSKTTYKDAKLVFNLGVKVGIGK